MRLTLAPDDVLHPGFVGRCSALPNERGQKSLRFDLQTSRTPLIYDTQELRDGTSNGPEPSNLLIQVLLKVC